MVSLLQMAILFGWGVVAIAAEGSAVVTLDDDGQVVAFADTPARAAGLSWTA